MGGHCKRDGNRQLHVHVHRLTAFAVALLATVGVAAGCSSEGPAASPRSKSSPDQLQAGANVEAWCDSRPEPVTCLPIEHARYVIVIHAQSKAPSNGLVFWDPGGPGLPLPDAEAPLDKLIPDAIDGFDVAFMVEPWIGTPPSDDCLTAAADGAPGEECGLKALFSQEHDIVQALEVASARTNEPFVGAYLQSFGATRSQAVLSKRAGVRWVVLESPGPVPGTSARKLIDARAEAIMTTLAKNCGEPDCRSAIGRHLGDWVSTGVPGSATGREIALGIIAVASLPRQNFAAIQRVQSALKTGEIPAALSDQLRRLGRSFELRGASSVQPALIGLWADTCPRLTDWAELGRFNSPLSAGFAWLYRGCNSIPSRGSFNSSRSVPTLILTGRQDTIVPPSIQSGWQRVLEVTTTISGAEHFWDNSAVTRRVSRWVALQSRP